APPDMKPRAADCRAMTSVKPLRLTPCCPPSSGQAVSHVRVDRHLCAVAPQTRRTNRRRSDTLGAEGQVLFLAPCGVILNTTCDREAAVRPESAFMANQGSTLTTGGTADGCIVRSKAAN